jgi:sulfate transport system ATP-binding protein
LFRPEDIALASSPEALDCPQLGRGEVEESAFAGSFERLRLRLPPMPGVRPIAPPVSFGSGSVLVEATRSQDQASRLPLRPGDSVWVGVRRIHALAHPGLSFLIVTDGSPLSQGALTLGGQIGRLAHARITLLGYGQKPEVLQRRLREAREQLGGGLAALETQATADPLAEAVAKEVERRPYDLVVLGFQRGRLVRHVGAEATLLSVLPKEDGSQALARSRAERFLASGARTLELLGVPAQTTIRTGPVRDQITTEVATGGYDLLVMGAPLPQRDGRVPLNGIVGQILNVINRPVLIVRSGV